MLGPVSTSDSYKQSFPHLLLLFLFTYSLYCLSVVGRRCAGASPSWARVQIVVQVHPGLVSSLMGANTKRQPLTLSPIRAI